MANGQAARLSPKAISAPGRGKAKRRTAESGCSGPWSTEKRGWSRVAAVPGQRHPRSPSGSPPSSFRTSCGTARSGAGDMRAARSTSANRTREGNLRQSRRKQEVAAWPWGTRQISDPAPQRRRLNPRQVSGIDLEAGALRWSRLLPRWRSRALKAGLWGPWPQAGLHPPRHQTTFSINLEGREQLCHRLDSFSSDSSQWQLELTTTTKTLTFINQAHPQASFASPRLHSTSHKIMNVPLGL